MPDAIPDPVLREVVAEIRAWSATRCHEPGPHDIRIVATTRDAAHALLYPGTGSSEEPVFFAVARGDFHLIGPGHTPLSRAPSKGPCLFTTLDERLVATPPQRPRKPHPSPSREHHNAPEQQLTALRGGAPPPSH